MILVEVFNVELYFRGKLPLMKTLQGSINELQT